MLYDGSLTTSQSFEVLPDTLQVLFVGSPRCGKKTLIWKLTHPDSFNNNSMMNDDHDDEEDVSSSIHVKAKHNDYSAVNESRNTNDYNIDDGDDGSSNNDISRISH